MRFACFSNSYASVSSSCLCVSFIIRSKRTCKICPPHFRSLASSKVQTAAAAPSSRVNATLITHLKAPGKQKLSLLQLWAVCNGEVVTEGTAALYGPLKVSSAQLALTGITVDLPRRIYPRSLPLVNNLNGSRSRLAFFYLAVPFGLIALVVLLGESSMCPGSP